MTSGTSANNDAAVTKGYNAFANKQTVLIYNGRVTDNNNKPVANAILMAPGDVRAFTNADGYFTLRSADTMLNVTVSSAGFTEEQTKLNSSISNSIVISPDHSSLSEVVVTGFGKKKQSRKTQTVALRTLQPAGNRSRNMFTDSLTRKWIQPLAMLPRPAMCSSSFR